MALSIPRVYHSTGSRGSIRRHTLGSSRHGCNTLGQDSRSTDGLRSPQGLRCASVCGPSSNAWSPFHLLTPDRQRILLYILHRALQAPLRNDGAGKAVRNGDADLKAFGPLERNPGVVGGGGMSWSPVDPVFDRDPAM